MEIQELINLVHENNLRIVHSLSGRESLGKRNKVVAGYLSLSMQHNASITYLVEKNFLSSAFTLLRPLFDAVYRGTWLALVANDEEVEDFSGNEEFIFKNTYKLAKDIDKTIDGTTFHDVYQSNSSLLHGLTHGGIEQIGRQFDNNGDTIKVTFSDEAVFALLNSTNVNLGMILLAFSVVEEDDGLTKLAHSIIKNK